jgi:DNA-binding NtrC family response regulator
VTSEAFPALQSHTWPGNVRELGNVVERAVILSRGSVIGSESFNGLLETNGSARRRPVGDGDGGRVDLPVGLYNLREIESHVIQRALEATGGHRSKAAKLLGVSERTLRNKLNTKPTS